MLITGARRTIGISTHRENIEQMLDAEGEVP